MTSTSHEAQTTGKNLSGVFILRLAQFPFLMLFVLLVPPMMGPDAYGQYALFIPIITLGAALANIGIGDIHGRFVPEFQTGEGEAGVRKLFTQMFALKALVAVMVSAACYLGMTFAYGDRFPHVCYVLAALAVLVADLEATLFSLLFGLNRMVRFSIREPVRRALSLGLVLLLFPRFGLAGALATTLVVEVALLAISAFWTWSYFSLRDLRIELRYLRPFLRYGLVLFIAFFLNSLWQRLGNLFIDRIVGDDAEIGFFDLANQIFLVALSLTIMLMNSLVPILTKFLVAGREDKIEAWSRRIGKYMSILTVGGFAVTVLIGEDLLSALIGKDFSAVIPMAIVLLACLWPMIVAQLGFLQSALFKKPGIYVQGLAVAVSMFVVGSLALIPPLGSMGCCVAMLVSCTVFAVFQIWCFRTALAGCVVEVLLCAAPALALLPISRISEDFAANAIFTVAFLLGYVGLLFATRRITIAEVRECIAAVSGG